MSEALRHRLIRRTVVNRETGCWEWQGYRRSDGYGEIGLGGRSAGTGRVHRVLYELHVGPIPDGLHVCHRCDVRHCLNPDHLFVGTSADNHADKVTKGRQARGQSLPHTRLTDEQVADIRSRYNPRFGPPKRGGRRSNAPELAAEFGITAEYVMQIVHGHYRKEA